MGPLPGKVSSHSTALPSLNFFSLRVQCLRVFIPLTVRPALLRKMDTGSLTCTQTWVHVVHERGVRHKQACTRVDSEGQKNCSSPCPIKGLNTGFVGFEFRSSNHCSFIPRQPTLRVRIIIMRKRRKTREGVTQGFHRLSETKFQDFSRLKICFFKDLDQLMCYKLKHFCSQVTKN